MVKHTQTIRLSVFDHFVGLTLKELIFKQNLVMIHWLSIIYNSNSEAVVRRCSVKEVFLKISQNSQKNTCARVFFKTFSTLLKKLLLATERLDQRFK